jgi:hypothetical protein
LFFVWGRESYFAHPILINLNILRSTNVQRVRNDNKETKSVFCEPALGLSASPISAKLADTNSLRGNADLLIDHLSYERYFLSA